MRTYAKKICACGCGEEFTPTGPSSRFKNVEHRERAAKGGAPASPKASKSTPVVRAPHIPVAGGGRSGKKPVAEASPLEQARAFLQQRRQLIADLRRQRGEAKANVAELEATLEELLELGDDVADDDPPRESPAPSDEGPLAERLRKAATEGRLPRCAKCRAYSTTSPCAICVAQAEEEAAQQAANRERLDHDAVSRPGAD